MNYEVPDHHYAPTIIWDHINNKEWDCGYRFEIHPLMDGTYSLIGYNKQTENIIIDSRLGMSRNYRTILEAKTAIGEWKLRRYKEWEFNQKNPVIHVY